MTPTARLAELHREEQISQLRREEMRTDTRHALRLRLGAAVSFALSVGAFVYLALTITT